MSAPGSKPARIAAAAEIFKRRVKWAARSAAVVVASGIIGATFDFEPMAIPALMAGVVGGFSVLGATRQWLRLRGLGVTARDALGDGWKEKARLSDDRPRAERIRDELERAGVSALESANYVSTLRTAVEDRMTIRETAERLSDADRELVPDVAPTADALLERVASLVANLDRLESDLPVDALSHLDERAGEVELEKHDTPDRDRRMSLLSRQRSSLADLHERRDVMKTSAGERHACAPVTPARHGQVAHARCWRGDRRGDQRDPGGSGVVTGYRTCARRGQRAQKHIVSLLR